MFTFRSAGESHGPGLTVLIEGAPAGVEIAAERIDAELARRQRGYGRGGRMAIEADRVEILGGIRWGRTTGAPIAFLIRNRDWENWREGMSPLPEHRGSIPPLTKVRPGHADLPGSLKYGFDDARNVLERSSARETASRVAAGAVAKAILGFFDIRIGSFVDAVGSVTIAPWSGESWADLHRRAEESDLRMPDPKAAEEARALIDRAKKEGDTLGGTFVCFALGLPPGLGSHVSWDRRLDGRIGRALLSIPAIKGAEIGIGFAAAALPGSAVHDEMEPGDAGDALRGCVKRPTNRAGGLEGGMTNGEPLWARAAMKPIPTLMKPLRTVDMATGEPLLAATERSDVSAVPAASVVGEAMLAAELAGAFLEKFGGDAAMETKRNYASYVEYLKAKCRAS